MYFHHIWLTTCLSPWTIFTFATLMSFLFFSKSHKKIPYFFWFSIWFRNWLFGKGVVGFSLSFMIYFTKKKQKTKKITKKITKKTSNRYAKNFVQYVICITCRDVNGPVRSVLVRSSSVREMGPNGPIGPRSYRSVL